MLGEVGYYIHNIWNIILGFGVLQRCLWVLNQTAFFYVLHEVILQTILLYTTCKNVKFLVLTRKIHQPN